MLYANYINSSQYFNKLKPLFSGIKDIFTSVKE